MILLKPEEKESNYKIKSVLIFASAQFFLLMAYSLTGFWKVFWGIIELFTKEVSLFSPLTLRNTIIYQFQLTESSNCSVSIYDLQGKLVQELMNENMASGQHSILLTGLHLEQGKYICELITNKGSQTIHIIK